jgi:hypothetical protein
MFELGNSFGYYGCIVYLIVMSIGLIFVMRKYLKED